MKVKSIFVFYTSLLYVMKKLLLPLFLFSAFLVNAQAPSITLQAYASGFTRPVDIRNCGDSRLFIVEQDGYINVVPDSGVVLPTPFLNIDARVGSSGNEQGLLGLAFHPNYKQNGYFYVNYTNNSGNTVISRFNVTAADSNIADPLSEVILTTINQPFSNHNGGCIQFGPDGYLYIGMGDGGSGGDPGNRAQNMAEKLGKILRIDVDNGTNYAIPPTNPFVGIAGAAPEIWAVGMRNPWRFSFDRITGDLWIADVGQGDWEEVDFQPAGSPGGINYGWRCYEGNHPYNTSGCQPQSSYDSAVFEMSHGAPGFNCSITGGYIYKGGKYNDLFGWYIFSDYCNDMIQVLKRDNGAYTHYNTISANGSISTFGEDQYGEIYVADLSGGTIKRLASSVCDPVAYISEEDTLYICADSVLLQTPFASGLIYSWQTPSGNSSGNTAWVTQDGMVSVTAMNISACISQDSVYVVLLGTPAQPSFTGLDSIYCNNGSADTLVATPAGGVFSGQGMNGDVFDPATVGNGIYTINYAYIDSNNCSSSTSQVVTVTGTQATFSGLDTAYCSNGGSADTLIGVPSGGTFTGQGINGNVFDPVAAGNGTYTINYQYVDPNNCSSSASQVVNVSTCSGINEATNGYGILTSYLAGDNLTIILHSAISGPTAYVLNDCLGRTLGSGNLMLRQGEQQISIPVNAEEGIYFWTLRGQSSITLRFAVVR